VELLAKPVVASGEQFSRPYIDLDEERTEPRPHRFVSGGFEGTTARFALYFPPPDVYQDRFLQQCGANLDSAAGPAMFVSGPLAALFGALDQPFEAGCYLISSVAFLGYDSEPGDNTYAHRATAASALQSRQIAAQVYGSEPAHGYIFGGSGGGRRTIDCMENHSDIWDGAVPFMTGGQWLHGNNSIFSSYYSSMSSVRRLLGPRLEDLIDRMDVGGSGDPFAGLNGQERAEVATMYRLGFPRGAESLMRSGGASNILWTWVVRDLAAFDPDFFTYFWSEPGYEGYDNPASFANDLVDDKAIVAQVLTPQDLMTFAGGDEVADVSAGMIVRASAIFSDGNVAVGLVLDREYTQDLAGARVRITSGDAAGRTLYLLGGMGNIVFASTVGSAEAVEGFNGVTAGDEVSVDNRERLAYCYYYRHHVANLILTVDGIPIYDQRPTMPWPDAWGGEYLARPNNKMILIQHAQDVSVWPPDMFEYGERVDAYLGDRRDDQFRLWWLDRCEHGGGQLADPGPVPTHQSRYIEYQPVIEQAIHDVIAWVEQGIAPAGDTGAELSADRALVLAPTAADRKGIQPVVVVTANGTARAHVNVGESVTLQLSAEVPPGAGTIVDARWDFDGSGSFPLRQEGIDGSKLKVESQTTHTYGEPGTYFVACQVYSRRDGDTSATRRRIPNIGRARVVVS
jgi:hypothetical protein